ncbi:hypothetical protein M422DRAFT_246410 [Sphaerobolus stellatus SS14]|nr:hypothetical protein M422DRAFT_246410 [Sphaerobolus stellatus SS14]
MDTLKISVDSGGHEDNDSSSFGNLQIGTDLAPDCRNWARPPSPNASTTPKQKASSTALARERYRQHGRLLYLESGFFITTTVSQGLLDNQNSGGASVSGLLGLGFKASASTGYRDAIRPSPLQWHSNKLKQNLMSFFLARHVDDQSGGIAPGSFFTLGDTNSSSFAGNIDFVNFPSTVTPPSFWLIPLAGATVGGKAPSNSTASSSESLAAIDTGTTLIGGPADGVTAIYALISAPPAAQADDGSVVCIGGIFDLEAGQTAPGQGLPALKRQIGGANGPHWIIGDTFLKNVYSVFRFNPSSVAFAQLSSSVAGSGTAGPTPASSSG